MHDGKVPCKFKFIKTRESRLRNAIPLHLLHHLLHTWNEHIKMETKLREKKNSSGEFDLGNTKEDIGHEKHDANFQKS